MNFKMNQTIDQTNPIELIDDLDLFSYDHYIIAFSGGKDSTACILWLLDQGVSRDKIELWHHLVDGKEDHIIDWNKKIDKNFMDWRITESYTKAFANALGLKIYYSWRIGGYRSEILKNECKPEDIKFETPDGIEKYFVKRGKERTRRMFPKVCNDLSKRYCTQALKIDVARIAITHQERFLKKKILFISGERAEESKNREQYQIFEIYEKVDNRDGKYKIRHVDSFRPVHRWKTNEVWQIIKKWKINPHPCYKIGYGRCSCAGCIFGSPSQYATLKVVSPKQFQMYCDLEKELNFSIHQKGKQSLFLEDFVNGAKPYQIDESQIKILNSNSYDEPIILDTWIEPSGMKGSLRGPC